VAVVGDTSATAWLMSGGDPCRPPRDLFKDNHKTKLSQAPQLKWPVARMKSFRAVSLREENNV